MPAGQYFCFEIFFLQFSHTPRLERHPFITTQCIRSLRWRHKRVRLILSCTTFKRTCIWYFIKNSTRNLYQIYSSNRILGWLQEETCLNSKLSTIFPQFFSYLMKTVALWLEYTCTIQNLKSYKFLSKHWFTFFFARWCRPVQCRWQAISVGKGVSSGTSWMIFTYRRSPKSRVYGVGTQDDYLVLQEEAGSVLTWITPTFILTVETKENSAFINKLQTDICIRYSQTQISVAAYTSEGKIR
jgi:hypothetical protein